MVCLLSYANDWGSGCSGHKGAAICFHWMPLPGGAHSVSLRQGHLHSTSTAGSCEVFQPGTVEHSRAVFFSHCTKLNWDYGAEIYIYFIIDLIKSSIRKQKLWAMQHLN